MMIYCPIYQVIDSSSAFAPQRLYAAVFIPPFPPLFGGWVGYAPTPRNLNERVNGTPLRSVTFNVLLRAAVRVLTPPAPDSNRGSDKERELLQNSLIEKKKKPEVFKLRTFSLVRIQARGRTIPQDARSTRFTR